jgi:hypothetical protein
MRVCPNCNSTNFKEEFENHYFCHDCSHRFALDIPDLSKLSKPQQKLLDQLKRAKELGIEAQESGGKKYAQLDEDHRSVLWFPGKGYFPADSWQIDVSDDDKERYQLKRTIHALIKKKVLADVDGGGPGIHEDGWDYLNDDFMHYHYSRWIVAFRWDVEGMAWSEEEHEWAWPGKHQHRWKETYGNPDMVYCWTCEKTKRTEKVNGNFIREPGNDDLFEGLDPDRGQPFTEEFRKMVLKEMEATE